MAESTNVNEQSDREFDLTIKLDERPPGGVSSVELIERAAVIAAEEADRQTEELRKQLAEANAKIDELRKDWDIEVSAKWQAQARAEQAEARAEAAEQRAQADWQKVQSIETEFTQQLRAKQAELDKSRELREQAEARAADLKLALDEAEVIGNVARMLIKAKDYELALDELSKINSNKLAAEYARAALNPDARQEGEAE